MSQHPSHPPTPQLPPPRRGVGVFFLFLGMAVISFGALGLFFAFFISDESEENLAFFGRRVAVVELHGTFIEVEDWIDLLEECEEDEDIAAVVLDIDSPGGAIAPTQMLCDGVEKIRKQGKPVVAALGSVAASGGYYVASSADEIVSMPGTLTGSIGVYVQLMNLTDLLEKVGVEFDVIKKGEFKTAGDFSRELEEDERRMFQSVVDDYYDQFLEAVLEGRKKNRQSLARGWNRPVPGSDETSSERLAEWGGVFYPSAVWGQTGTTAVSATPLVPASGEISSVSLASTTAPTLAATSEVGPSTDISTASREAKIKRLAESLSDSDLAKRVSQLAEGRIYTGRQAAEVGLVDRLGTLEDAIDRAAKEAGMVGEPRTVRKSPREERGLFGRLKNEARLLQGSKFLYLSPFAY